MLNRADSRAQRLGPDLPSPGWRDDRPRFPSKPSARPPPRRRSSAWPPRTISAAAPPLGGHLAGLPEDLPRAV